MPRAPRKPAEQASDPPDTPDEDVTPDEDPTPDTPDASTDGKGHAPTVPTPGEFSPSVQENLYIAQYFRDKKDELMAGIAANREALRAALKTGFLNDDQKAAILEFYPIQNRGPRKKKNEDESPNGDADASADGGGQSAENAAETPAAA